MQRQTALIIGATGLIGSTLLQRLLADDNYDRVRILVRRPVDISHPKLEVQPVNFNDTDELSASIGSGHHIFSCIGTTQKQVKGDKQLYRKIDYEIPVTTARIGFQQGFRQFIAVSAIGANAASGNFYLQLKGAMEEDIAAIPFEAVHVFRPSLLMGNRKEFRLGEKIAQGVLGLLSFVFIGGISKYKPVAAEKVAQSMQYVAYTGKPGIHYYQYPFPV